LQRENLFVFYRNFVKNNKRPQFLAKRGQFLKRGKEKAGSFIKLVPRFIQKSKAKNAGF
jgi:hypothetical protein